MNNLTTRKIVLGLLMTLVLAFGVQGIADAVETDLENSEDFAAKVVGGGIGTPITIVATTEDADTTESITIETSGIQLTSPDFATTITYSEATAEDKETATKKRLDDSTIILNGYFTSVGKRTITITYKDLATATEISNGDQDSAINRSYTYTYYAVKVDRDISRTTSIGLEDVRNGYTTGVTGRQDFDIYSGTSTSSRQYPVTYTVAGGGKAYVFKNGSRLDIPTEQPQPISSAIRVYLDANAGEIGDFDEGNTNVVTVRIGNTSAFPKSEFTAAYIYGTPTLDIDLPDEVGVTQVDITGKYSFIGGTAGEDAGTITATVRDGKIDVGTLIPGVGTLIPGVVVQFDVVDKSVRGGWMIPFASVDVDTDTDTDTANGLSDNITDSNGLSIVHSTPLFPARTLYVRTDSDGEAKVTYRFGTASGTQRIAVSAVGKSKTLRLNLNPVTCLRGYREKPLKNSREAPKSLTWLHL